MWVIYAHLIFLHLLALTWAFHSSMGGPNPTLDIFFNFTMAVAIVYTCSIDAKLRLTPLTDAAKQIMCFFWPIAGPLYLIYSRRWLGILWALLWTVSIFFFCYVVPAGLLETVQMHAR